MTIQHTNTMLDGFRARVKNDQERQVLPLGRSVFEAIDLVERVHQCRRLAEAPGQKPCLKEVVAMRARRIYYRRPYAPLERRRHGFVFVNPYGKPYNAANLGQMVRQLAIEAGIVKRDPEGRILLGENGKPMARISAYSFRHMVATHNTVLPPHIGAAVRGHSEQTYLGTYVHMDAGDQLRIADSLNALEEDVFGGDATNLQQRLLTG